MATNLFVNRLRVIAADGGVAYDERFHHGVNIIRGDNSSGKSTITQLLFYALGGHCPHFVAEVSRCREVFVEVQAGAATMTLSRPITVSRTGGVLAKQPMTIHWGTLDEAVSQTCDSHQFGYAATSQRQSFSAALFDLLQIPHAHADSAITMHQLLRLMYVDQDTPSQMLFCYEPFDRQEIRESVADLLMGIFDHTLYDSKKRQRSLQDELKENRLRTKTLISLMPFKELTTTDAINAHIREKEEQIRRLQTTIAQCRKQGAPPAAAPFSQTQHLREQVATLRQTLHRQEDDRATLLTDITDTSLFLSELRRKHNALLRAMSTRQVMGSLTLTHCPECLRPLPLHAAPGTCHLCRQPLATADGITPSRRIAMELGFQIQDSERILTQQQQRLTALDADLAATRSSLRAQQQSLDAALADARPTHAARLEDLVYQKGLLEGQLSESHALLRTATLHERLLSQQAQLQGDLAAVERDIQQKTAAQQQRRQEVMAAIGRHGAYLLNHDMRREATFASASAADFCVDFSNNTMFLASRHAKHSASSTFVLKLAARFAIFLASLDVPFMRYPRFLLADNMEDKGIEPQRAQELQRTLIHLLSRYPQDTYQLIYTTSYITPDLNQSPYTVGPYYTVDHKSLQLES